MTRWVALLLAAVMLLSNAAVPVFAAQTDSEDPLAMKDFETFGSPLLPTEPQTAEEIRTEPSEAPDLPGPEPVTEETKPAETAPAVTETVPEEILPAEPVHEETESVPLPEETAAAESDAEAEQEEWPMGHNGVPLYFQNDYPNNMYGMGTIASNGCSAASLAMVATYLTGHEYLPDEIARYFGGAAENNIARLEEGSKTMRLPMKKAKDWHELVAAIEAGKIAIVLVDSGSVFTQSQHFIVVTGMTEDGKMLVNDSWKPNYEKWDCKEGLKNGFDPSAILAGWSGAWIYDKAAMPEEPYLYSEPAPVRGEPRYGVELTQEEIKLLAKVVWVEARGECEKGQQAVAEVALNRLVSDRFPNNLHDVIYGEGQFRSAKFLDKAEPYQMQYEVIENALYGPYVLPMDVFYFATSPETSKKWGWIGGHVFCYAVD